MNDILYKSMKVTIMESIISKAAMKERDINRSFDIIFLRRLDIRLLFLNISEESLYFCLFLFLMVSLCVLICLYKGNQNN